MPVYNASKYLRESIDSVLRQTYENFELIIVNDGSSDSSMAIITHYAEIDSRIVAISQDNKGVVASANKAASLAKGSYITRNDSDDVAFDNKIADLVSTALANPRAVLVTGNIEVISQSGEFMYRDIVPIHSDDIKRALYFRNPLPNGACMVRKDAFEEVGGYSDVFAEDLHLWIKLYGKGDFAHTNSSVYKWRMNDSGLTFSNVEKSIQKEKEYTDTIWEHTLPARVTRREIRSHSAMCLVSSKRYGTDYKKIYMYDLSRLCSQLIKKGYKKQGILQLLTLASTGRTGLIIAVHRIKLVISGQINRRKSASLHSIDPESSSIMVEVSRRDVS